ncbi:L-glutamate gamma-semialdehyde dehydrogenase [Actinocorallia populi]|uniref:L-glutamate gamma-semialdehyde dehydrogenase n=1 Tax=Actinocorallia populi TaxID=2079200 RepID=UPI000D08AB0B|nr:L-glutamate gamma-semialdehyde dehydrogenase [Actinocorallia populi]
MDAITNVPVPVNEPVHGYAPGSPERARLEARLEELSAGGAELTCAIGGERRMGGGGRVQVVQPHRHAEVLGVTAHADHADAQAAVEAARAAAPGWRELSFEDRAAVLLRAADLLTGPWRETIAAATMLGQSKTAQQAEIDAPCELADFWRFNVHYARQILAEQPESSPGVWNRADHRPLEGFVYAVTPFNFTAIAANLPTSPALMGNTVVWKPSITQQFAAHHTMALLEEAGLPPGVINMVTGDGLAVSDVALTSPDLAGIHFTGSTPTFQHLWRTVAENLPRYRSYPRLVGETGGKDFIVAHPSADPAVLVTAMVRGAFEYQGQKCSAASRAYVPRSLWHRIEDELAAVVDGLTMGDVRDLGNFMGAVIDARSFGRLKGVLEGAAADPAVRIVAGGTCDDSEGYFVRPTVLLCDDPGHDLFRTEFFGPVLAVHVYEDGDYEAMLAQMESVSPYALTGAVIARDRAAIAHATAALRFAAGNFYVNDKPTGAVVGQQPFGGGRASGTNDKAGSAQNLLRWTSTRTIKETFVPPTDHRYPHMG